MAVLIISPPLIFFAANSRHFIPLFLAIIPTGILLYIGYGFILSAVTLWALSKKGKRGILVYSESPNWQEYVERNWIPRFGDKFITLNWSHRKLWKNTLAVRMFKYFVGTQNNFNPSIILLRKRRWPTVYRFYPAFRDAKHGDQFALQKLEDQLFKGLNAA